MPTVQETLRHGQLLLRGGAAKLADVSGECIAKWTAKGWLQPIVTGDGKRLYFRADVERVARERKAAREKAAAR